MRDEARRVLPIVAANKRVAVDSRETGSRSRAGRSGCIFVRRLVKMKYACVRGNAGDPERTLIAN